MQKRRIEVGLGGGGGEGEDVCPTRQHVVMVTPPVGVIIMDSTKDVDADADDDAR